MSDFAATISEAYATAASTYPSSDFYDLEELLTQMGIGDAAVTILSEDDVPTPVVHTRLRAPGSRIGPADDVERTAKASPLFAKYGTRADAESAREMLAARMAGTDGAEPAGKALGDFLTSREGKALQKKVMRGVFGMLRKRL